MQIKFIIMCVMSNYLFEMKLTLVPIYPATTAGRFLPPYIQNLMQKSEK